jgi:phage anti-repressor protein
VQNQLIPVASSTIGSETIPTVNARNLHAFLEIGKDFSTWIKDRIESFGFVENRDFIVFPEIGEKGGRPSLVYHLALDMAKELSMVERNAKGKEARLYFIECERRAKVSATAIADPFLAQLEMVKTVYLQQQELSNRMTLLEAKAITRDESFFTAAGYCNLKGIRLDRAGMLLVGKLAAHFSRDQNLVIGKVYDSRYGEVNEYHVSALQYAVKAE